MRSNILQIRYQKESADVSELQYNTLKRLEVSREQNLELKKYYKYNCFFFIIPFDEESLRLQAK